MDEYKQFQITSERTGKKYDIVVLIKDHAYDRLAERATVEGSKEKIYQCIDQAARHIIDDYPEILPGDYSIKSKSIGLKFPLTVYPPVKNTIAMKIPTILTMSMSKRRDKYKPALTFESFYYSLNSKEIIVE